MSAIVSRFFLCWFRIWINLLLQNRSNFSLFFFKKRSLSCFCSYDFADKKSHFLAFFRNSTGKVFPLHQLKIRCWCKCKIECKLELDTLWNSRFWIVKVSKMKTASWLRYMTKNINFRSPNKALAKWMKCLDYE